MNNPYPSEISSRAWSRREVLLTAAGTGLAGGLLRTGPATAALNRLEEKPDQWPVVHVAYLRPKQKYWLGWPGTSWDVKGFINSSRQSIQAFADEIGLSVRSQPQPLYDAAAVDAFIRETKAEKPAAILVLPLHMDRWPMVEKIARCDLPTIIFAPMGVCFTGHIQEIARLPRVYLASSPDFEFGPIRFGLKMVRTHHDVGRSKIVVIAGKETKEKRLDPFGLTLRYVPRDRFPQTLKQIEETAEVQAIADEYRNAARKIVEPTPNDLINAAKNYVAARRIMKEEGCQGVTMDCLGLVSDRQIPCPPCMAWSKLLDEAAPAICEADINAVMSHTLCCWLLDKVGFQQDPVPETVNNTFIGAHCVCGTRLDGYDKPPAPFILRSHAESDIGVSLQVLWEPGRDVTIMQFTGPDKMILGSGKVLRNLNTPPCGGCRTSVELAIDAPADVRDTKGFHQLFIAGNHMRDFQAYGQMYGIQTEHV